MLIKQHIDKIINPKNFIISSASLIANNVEHKNMNNKIYDPIPNTNTYFNPPLPFNPIIMPVKMVLIIITAIPVYATS